MPTLYFVTAGLLLLSVAFNRTKTLRGLAIGLRMFIHVLPTVLGILMVVSVVLTWVGPETIQRWLGENSGPAAYVLAALIGAVALMPGFVAFPMAKMLAGNGVAWGVIAVFITSLMMVGVLTLPIEKKYFGMKVALARNGLNFIGAIVIGLAMAFTWNLL